MKDWPINWYEFFIFFSFPVSGGKQGSYFFTLETSARQREETVRGQKLFSRVWRSWAFHSDGAGCSGEDRCRGSIFKHKVEQGNPYIKKVWRMASLETSWNPCPAPSRALGGQALWGTIGDLPRCVHAQSCPALCSCRDYSPAGSSAHGIFQARILEQVAISFSGGSSRLRAWTCGSCIGKQILYLCAAGKGHISAILSSATMNWGGKYLFVLVFSVSLNKCPEVECWIVW